MLDKLKVGNTATIGFYTDDEELNAFLEIFGNEIVITEVEEEDGELTGNFWGVNLYHKIHCPFHIEFMDVTDIDETNLNVNDFKDFKICKEPSELSKGDIIHIKSLKQYEEDGGEITELVKQFAGKDLKVISVSEEVDEWGYRTVLAESPNGSLVSFTEFEIDYIIGE